MKLTERKKLLIYKALIAMLAIIVIFMPSTAARSREVNSRVIVEMLGVDTTDSGDVEVTAQYVMPTDKDATSKDKLTVSAKSITQAVEQLSTSLGRRAELGHCSMVILGDKARPEDLATLMTATDVTADVYLAAADGKSSELISDLTDFIKKTGATDADFIAYGAKKSHIATNTLLGFLSDLGSGSHTAYVPVVEMIKDESGQGGESGSDGGGSGGQSSGGQSASGGSGGEGGSGDMGMKVEKLALYGKSGRTGVLDRTAARGVAWASAPVQNSVVTADIERGEKVECMSGKLIKKTSRVDIDAKARKATVKVRATVEPNCNTYNEIMSQKDPQKVGEIKDAFARSVKDELAAAYEKSSALGCDPMFIMRKLYRCAPDVYDNTTLRDISVCFDVDIVLK